jgi:hypothetical protein
MTHRVKPLLCNRLDLSVIEIFRPDDGRCQLTGGHFIVFGRIGNGDYTSSITGSRFGAGARSPGQRCDGRSGTQCLTEDGSPSFDICSRVGVDKDGAGLQRSDLRGSAQLTDHLDMPAAEHLAMFFDIRPIEDRTDEADFPAQDLRGSGGKMRRFVAVDSAKPDQVVPSLGWGFLFIDAKVDG